MSPAFDRMQALPDTRKVERPKLESRPLPKGWSRQDQHFVHATGCGYDMRCIEAMTSAELDDMRAYARGLVDLADWAIHERAVRAQEGGR